MARPRNICFYEREILSPLLESQQWLTDYHKNSQRLVDYMVEKGAGSTAYYATIRCLTSLREYLLQEEEPYTAEKAQQWFIETGPYPKGYQATLSRIADLIYLGDIQPLNAFPRALPYKEKLIEPWRSILEGFLATTDYKKSSLIQVKNFISRFLYKIQKEGISKPSDITFGLLEEYCLKDFHSSDSSKARYTYAIGDILLYMADQGLCIHGLGWYPYFRMHKRIVLLSDLTDDQNSAIEALREESLDFPAEEYAELIPDFLERYIASGYSKTPCITARYVLYNLLLFLEMHGLGYNQKIAEIWLEHEKKLHKGTGWCQASRVLYIFDLYLQEGDVIPQSINRTRPLLSSTLPVWCQEVLFGYLALKKKEGSEKSTINMIRSSITRFCSFLAGTGLKDFSEISAECLKEFNSWDTHYTAEGKNAYNVRIRKFIKYLERKGTLPYGTHQALGCTAAAKEKIVVTLTSEEKDAVKEKLATSQSPLELRDKAIMLLGIRMGLRSSDIVAILLEDIDWDKQALRVIQEKTNHEILLPMPTDVGNAIYRYLVNGRANDRTSSRHLFIKTKVPYDSMKCGICQAVLRRILPDRSVHGSGFHVTRKTFATERLCRGTGKQGIADLLGHKNTLSLSYYLSLDEERMRMCPLSLTETGLVMEGGRYDDI